MSLGPRPDGAGRLIANWSCGASLPAVGPGISLGWSYHSDVTADTLYGLGGCFGSQQVLQADAFTPPANPAAVSLQRPSGALISYSWDAGSGSYLSTTATNLSTLGSFTDDSGTWWRETSPAGAVDVYPVVVDGGLCSVAYAQDAVGNRTSYSYDSGRLAGIEEPTGRRVTLTYASGRLAAVEDWGQRLTTYQYDTASVPGHALLTTITGPSGCATGYGYTTAYTGSPLLDSVIDPNGYQTTYAYYADGRCSEVTLAGVGTWRYTFTDGWPQQTVATDPLGFAVTTTFYNTLQPWTTVGPDGLVTTTLRNEAGLSLATIPPSGAITSVTRNVDWPFLPLYVQQPFGLLTSFSHDAYFNQVAVQPLDHAGQTLAYGGMGYVTFLYGPLTTFVYGYDGSSFDTTGEKRRLQATTDALGYTTSWTYNAQGQVTAVTAADGRVTSFGYDAYGRQVSTTDPLGHVTTRTFDAVGNVLAVQDPLGYLNSTVYDSVGRPVAMIDPLGYRTSLGYDSGGRLTVRQDPFGYRTSYTYNALDQLVGVQDALGNLTTNSYDAAGRLLASQDALGNVTALLYDAFARPVGQQDALGRVVSAVYDSVGRVAASVDALGYRTTTLFDAADRPLALQNALGYRTTTVFDVDGRAAASMDPLGQLTTAVYDVLNRQVASIDPLGRVTSTVYDSVGRRLAEQDARGGLTTYSYDAASRQVALVDANGHAWSNTYDACGGLLAETDPLGARTSFSYDGRGSRQLRVDARGWPSTYTLDALGRTTQIAYRDGTFVTYLYDPLGRVQEMLDGTGTTSYTYDALGRQLGVIGPQYTDVTTGELKSQALSYTYDPVGNRETLIEGVKLYGLPEGDWAFLGTNTYTYDANNRVTGLVRLYNEFTTWQWDALGRLQTQVLGNGVSASYSYDPVGRATALGYRRADGDLLSLYTATYDPAGNRLRVDELDGRFLYGYDARDQLVYEQRLTFTDPFAPFDGQSFTATYACTYTYDPVGNRLAQDDGTTIVQSTYNAADELLSTQPCGPSAPNVASLPPLVSAPISRDALALNLPLPEGFRYTAESAGVNLVGGGGSYDASNHWLVALQTRDASLGVTSTLATATFGQAGAGRVDFGGLDTPVESALSVALQRIGNPPPVVVVNGAVGMAVQTAGQATSFAYDSNGNTVSEIAPSGTTTFTWDTENRLTGVNAAGAVETYTYDSSTSVPGKVTGLRQSKTTAAGTTYFLWDGQNVLAELDANLDRLAQYTDFPGRWGGLSSRLANDGLSWYGFDLSANTRRMWGADAAAVEAYLCSAFGVELAGTGGSNRYRFGGQVRYLQESIERLYVQARHLAPYLGRWTSVDPDQGQAGPRYLYADSRPVTDVDPSGLATVCYRSLAGPTWTQYTSHPWLITSCGTTDWGPGQPSFDPSTHGHLVIGPDGHARWETVPGNPGWVPGPPGSGVRCVDMPTTPAQDSCICKAATAAQYGAPICGRTWTSRDYNVFFQNSQHYVGALMKQCGVPYNYNYVQPPFWLRHGGRSSRRRPGR